MSMKPTELTKILLESVLQKLYTCRWCHGIRSYVHGYKVLSFNIINTALVFYSHYPVQ
jgi:hypothetical protein